METRGGRSSPRRHGDRENVMEDGDGVGTGNLGPALTPLAPLPVR